MTTIRYFLPEDGDLENYPNVFLASKPAQQGFSPRLRDIKESFPLPGRYHFRFKSPLVPGTDREKGAVAVWMDCVDDDQHVGVWRNAIIAKVTRLSAEDDSDDDDDFDRHAPTNLSARVSQSAPVSRHTSNAPSPNASQHGGSLSGTSDALLDVFDDPPPAAAPKHASTENLWDTDHHNSNHGAPSPAPAAVATQATLLDMDGPVYNHGPSSAHNDLLGMMASPQAAPAPPPIQQHRQQQQQSVRQLKQPMPQQVRLQPPPKAGNPPPARHGSNGNAFDSFSSSNGDFSGLNWS